MSQAPGDLPLETQVVAGKRGRFASRSAKWLIILLAALAILAGGAWWWRSMPAPPRWVDIREGDGAVLSIATGRDPEGNEIIVAGGYCRTDDSGRDLRVVCYDAAKGRVRWEARENQALPNMLIQPNVTIDPAGDVLMGCDISSVRRGEDKAVWKYSGRDGHRLWDWKMEISSKISFIKTIPSPSRTGGLWISAIREDPKGARRFVAALDSKTGVALWQHDLNPADDSFDRPARIHTLRDGGAILVIPPPHSRNEFPWLIQHRSNDGELAWEHEMFNLPDLSEDLPQLADETKGQLVLAWNSFTSGVNSHFTSLDLATGDERWHVRHNPPCEVEALTQDLDGGIELWGRHVEPITRTKWGRWEMRHGFPRPVRLTEFFEQPLRITLSPTDGALVKSEPLSHREECVIARLTEPGTEPIKMVILRTVDAPNTVRLLGPWRAVEINSKSSFDFLARQPGGDADSDSFPEHAALTPSGRLVIAGDPAVHKFQWQIRVW